MKNSAGPVMIAVVRPRLCPPSLRRSRIVPRISREPSVASGADALAEQAGEMVEQLILALAAAGAVAAMARLAGALDTGGALAATVVGACVLGFAGWGPAFVLVFFFASASALSALPGKRGRPRRGARQVLANGSIATAAAVLHGVVGPADLAFLGAVAAATADTWATEIGVRLGKRPRSVVTFRPQQPGASGAISLPGTLASAAGALAVAAAGLWLAGGAPTIAVALGGLGGSLIDSLLGAGPQAVYRCPVCGEQPEVARHAGCREPARRLAGLPGLDNDAVNWLATAGGASIAVFLGSAL